jgi:predicted N-acyltransferase
MAETQVIVYQHASDIDEKQWARLAENRDARLARKWFLLNENDISSTSRYIGLRSHDGDLYALAPCLISETADSGFASYRATDALFTPEIIRGEDPVGLSRAELIEVGQQLRNIPLFPSIAVASPYAPYAPISELFAKTAANPDSFSQLLAAIEKLANDVSARLWAILGIPDGSPLLKQANNYGFLPALISADTTMQISWKTFDDYLAALPSRRRSFARRELARLGEHAITIALEPDASILIDDLARISASHHESHDHIVDVASERMYFDDVVKLYGKDFRVISARRHGELIGFCSLLSNGSNHKGFEFGIDHTKADRSDDLFPNLMYSSIRQVIEMGGGSFTFSATNYKAKLLRGCSLELLWGLYKPLNPTLHAALLEYLPHFNRLQFATFESLQIFQGHLKDDERGH